MLQIHVPKRIDQSLMSHVHVVVQIYLWFKFYFLLFLGIVMYDNEIETKENKIWTKDKIEPKHTHQNERIHAILKKFILTVLLNRRANLKAREKKNEKEKDELNL